MGLLTRFWSRDQFANKAATEFVDEEVKSNPGIYPPPEVQAKAFALKAHSADYDRILKARGGVAVANVSSAAVCGGCRVTIRPQAIQELRVATELMRCESCGRFLYWKD